MSSRLSFLTMTAMVALIAAPVLAQTANTMPTQSSPPPSGVVTAPPGPPSTTSPAAVSPMASSSSSASSTSTGSSFTTADQQIRASKLIGSSVYNDQKQKIGSVDELLVDQNHAVTDVVLSVGGFLGIDSKLVKVPYNGLHLAGDQIVMPGATKDQLTQMPDYKFASAT